MDQIKSLFGGLSFFQRVSVAIAALFAAAVVLAVTHYRGEADFHPLYTNMAAEDAAPVVQKLKESGVEYRLGDNGTTVLVRSGKIDESRLTLAAAGLPKSGRIGFELFDKTSFGATELVEHVNYQRALEGELERSIMSMNGVTQARVHLSLSKDSVFLDQRQPAKASVMVKLKPGTDLTPANVVAITNLVGSAVEGLSADAVAVLDMDGNLLNRPRPVNADESQVTSEALDVRSRIEHELVAKIESTLQPLLGLNKFRAGASVDCDLTSGDQQEETFDPDKSVMVSSQKIEDGAERGSSRRRHSRHRGQHAESAPGQWRRQHQYPPHGKHRTAIALPTRRPASPERTVCLDRPHRPLQSSGRGMGDDGEMARSQVGMTVRSCCFAKMQYQPLVLSVSPRNAGTPPGGSAVLKTGP